MKYDFDEYVSREKTDSLTVDGWREYLFSGQSEFAMRYPAEGLMALLQIVGGDKLIIPFC